MKQKSTERSAKVAAASAESITSGVTCSRTPQASMLEQNNSYSDCDRPASAFAWTASPGEPRKVSTAKNRTGLPELLIRPAMYAVERPIHDPNSTKQAPPS